MYECIVNKTSKYKSIRHLPQYKTPIIIIQRFDGMAMIKNKHIVLITTSEVGLVKSITVLVNIA